MFTVEVTRVLYSLSHVGETLRSYLAAYPSALREQARLLPAREWLGLRMPWIRLRKLLKTRLTTLEA